MSWLGPANRSLTNQVASSFPLTENPISEAGRWATGGSGRTVAQTNGAGAFGTMDSFDGTNYIDSIAALQSFGSCDYDITGVVANNGAGSLAVEAELLVCYAGPNQYYEFDLVNSSTELNIVRMNGAPNTFTISPAGPLTTNVSMQDGDVWVVQKRGYICNVTCNGNSVLANFDLSSNFSGGAVYSNGTPGMGFWNQTGSSANRTKLGWKSWKAVPR